MSLANGRTEPLAPIFIVADDDEKACAQLMSLLGLDWTYIPVTDPRRVIRYARQFATTAILLSDQIAYPDGGAARLLQRLLDEVGKPVLILAELWDPELALKWKRMGACDCLPHPTRPYLRAKLLNDRLIRLGLGESTRDPGTVSNGRQRERGSD
jgi:FixJ family two-component response regulator